MHKSLLPLVVLLLASASAVSAAPVDPGLPRLQKILKATPLIDGHNDWPGTLVSEAGDKR